MTSEMLNLLGMAVTAMTSAAGGAWSLLQWHSRREQSRKEEHDKVHADTDKRIKSVEDDMRGMIAQTATRDEVRALEARFDTAQARLEVRLDAIYNLLVSINQAR